MCPWQWLGRSWRNPRLTAKLLLHSLQSFHNCTTSTSLHSLALALMAFVSNLTFWNCLNCTLNPSFFSPFNLLLCLCISSLSHKQCIMLVPAAIQSRRHVPFLTWVCYMKDGPEFNPQEKKDIKFSTVLLRAWFSSIQLKSSSTSIMLISIFLKQNK